MLCEGQERDRGQEKAVLFPLRFRALPAAEWMGEDRELRKGRPCFYKVEGSHGDLGLAKPRSLDEAPSALPRSNLHLGRRGTHSRFLVEDSWLRKRARRREHAEASLPQRPLGLGLSFWNPEWVHLWCG